jgi:hypothetical protein
VQDSAAALESHRGTEEDKLKERIFSSQIIFSAITSINSADAATF